MTKYLIIDNDRSFYNDLFNFLNKIQIIENANSNEEMPIKIQSIREYLIDIGIPTDKVGFYFLKDAISFLCENSMQTVSITKDIYPHVAKKNNTSTHNVERGIRYIVNFLWRRTDNEILEKICGHSFKKTKPTNGEFIYRIYEKVRNIYEFNS